MKFLEKKLKGVLKRKIKITEKLLVSFLILGFSTFSSDKIYNEKDILDNTILSSENGAIAIKDSLSGKVLATDKDFVNNGNITLNLGAIGGHTTAPGRDNVASGSFKNSGNGIQTVKNVENNKNIKINLFVKGGQADASGSSASTETSGNGIYNGGNIKNNGYIFTQLNLQGGKSFSADPNASSGSAVALESGNGLYNVGKVENNGIISSKLELIGGTSEAFAPNNTAGAVATTRNSGNVIYNAGDVVNNGHILSDLNLQGGNSLGSSSMSEASATNSGNAIYNSGNIKNQGNIRSNLYLLGGNSQTVNSRAILEKSGNAVYKSGDIENNGNIITKSQLCAGENAHGSHALESGNAIYEAKEIVNKGIISSEVTIKGRDNSSYSQSSTINSSSSANGILTSTKVENSGEILSNIVLYGGKVSSSDIQTNLPVNSYQSANGIYNSGIVKNSGNIKTDISLFATEINGKKGVVSGTTINESGNGIANSTSITNQGNIWINLNSKSGKTTSKEEQTSALTTYTNSGNGIFNSQYVLTDGNIRIKIKSLSEDQDSKMHGNIPNTLYESGNGVYNAQNLNNNGYISNDLFLKGTTQSKAELSLTTWVSSNNSGNIAFNLKDVKNSGKLYGNLTLIGGKGISKQLLSGGANSSLSANGMREFLFFENTGNITTSVFLEGGESIVNSPFSYENPYSYVASFKSGNGVYDDILNNVENKGVLSGYISQKEGEITKNGTVGKDYALNVFSGNGIAFSDRLNKNKNINNEGVIKGSQSAIAGKDEVSFNEGSINNYGILSGREIFSDGKELKKNSSFATYLAEKRLTRLNPTTAINYGIYVKLKEDLNEYDLVKKDSNGNVIIESISNANGNSNESETLNTTINKIILNTAIVDLGTAVNHNYDSFKEIYGANNLFIDYIINGAGNSKGVLDLSDSSKINLENTIVNSYKTAIVLNGNNSLNGISSIFNGGGLKGKDSVILSKGDNNNIDLRGSSFVNGNMTNIGNDFKLSLKDTTRINGDISLTGDRAEIVVSNSTIINGDFVSKGEEIKMKLNDNSKINGNISIQGNKSEISLNDNSYINGDVILKGNDSKLSIYNSVKLNGDILSDSNGQNNRLQLGNGSSEELNIFKKIDNFSNIDIKGRVNLFESASINKGDINISKGKLVLRINAGDRDNEGKIKGHALYNHKGRITYSPSNNLLSTGDIDNNAILQFRVSGLSVGEVIAMNGTDISSFSNEQIGTLSLVHTGIKTKDGDVKIDIKNWDDLTPDPTPNPTPDKDSEKLGKIYTSIKNSNQIGLLSLTTDLYDGRTDALPELVSLLDQIYANNPYSYGGLMSKYSLDMFREGVYSSSSTIPEVEKYITTGQILYSYNQYRDVEKNNSYGSESQKNSYSSYSNTNGLLGTIEYGTNTNESVGFAIGGAKQKLYMDHSSNLEGDAVYLGLFYKKNVNKFKFITGLGYQYSMYDSERKIGNKYQGFKNEGDFNTNSLNVYGEAKYILVEDKGWSIEPKLKLSYTYVNQESVSEDNAPLSIDVDKTEYNYFDTEIGIDFVKEKTIQKGKIKATSSISYINSQGTSDKDIIGRMKNSTDFDIQGQVLNRNNGKAGLSLELEKDNGMTYSVGADIIFAAKEQRNVNAKVGIGYKF